MNEDVNKQLDDLRGRPAKVVIFGEERTVECMSMDTQIEVLEKIGKMSGGEDVDASGLKSSIGFMKMIVAAAVGSTEEEIGRRAKLSEVLSVFPVVWAQNEFGFLLQRARAAIETIKA